MTEWSDQLESAPLALLLVESDGNISRCNRAASDYGFTTGETLGAFIPSLQVPVVDLLLHGDAQSSHLFRFRHAEKRFSLHVQPIGKTCYVWLKDLTAPMALAEQLRYHKQPDQKRTRQIRHQVVTALGYAELLDVIMDDNQVLSAEKMAAVRRYQAEITNALNRMQRVIADQAPDEHDGLSVIVVDAHQDLTELLTELLRTEGFKVTGFTDAASALKYCALNKGSVHRAIVDENLLDDNNMPLPVSLKALMPDTQVVVLSSNNETPGAIRKPVDFQQLLQVMLD